MFGVGQFRSGLVAVAGPKLGKLSLVAESGWTVSVVTTGRVLSLIKLSNETKRSIKTVQLTNPRINT